jgi:hypothetical protein
MVPLLHVPGGAQVVDPPRWNARTGAAASTMVGMDPFPGRASPPGRSGGWASRFGVLDGLFWLVLFSHVYLRARARWLPMSGRKGTSA